MSNSSDGDYSSYRKLGGETSAKAYQEMQNQTHYALLGLHPSASVIDIRRAYRELSKRYHPDTTNLPTAIATSKFQQINEAYATLSHPERRSQYDLKIGYSRFYVVQTPSDNSSSHSQVWKSSSAYLDPTDRPLSAGELFALFLLGLTFLGCLLLVIAIGITRGDTAFPPPVLQQSKVLQQVTTQLTTHTQRLETGENIKYSKF